MLPSIFLPTLNFSEFVVFEILHTCIHFMFLALLIFYGVKFLSREGDSFQIKDTLKNAGIITSIEVIFILCSNFFVFFGAIMLVLGSCAFLFVDFVVLYILFREIMNWSKIKMILLYFITIIPTILFSAFLTEFIFHLAGLPNVIILPFF